MSRLNHLLLFLFCSIAVLQKHSICKYRCHQLLQLDDTGPAKGVFHSHLQDRYCMLFHSIHIYTYCIYNITPTNIERKILWEMPHQSMVYIYIYIEHCYDLNDPLFTPNGKHMAGILVDVCPSVFVD